MKSVAFEYARPTTVREAVSLLAEHGDAKILAGGQTLGPLLNLRLAQPTLLIDITRIPELAACRQEPDAVTIGATVTHAAIEDGQIADPSRGFLARVAHGIAYRAVRSRGTIGGSLAHADPAADWLSCLTALGAGIEVAGLGGTARHPLVEFVVGAMQTRLAREDIVTGIRIPSFSTSARFGYHKICRKTGEFADAIGVAVRDPERGIARLVVSTSSGRPIVLESTAAIDAGAADLKQRLTHAGFVGDTYAMNVAATALQRAVQDLRP